MDAGSSTSIGTSISIDGPVSVGRAARGGTTMGAAAAAVGAGRELRRTVVPRREADGGYEFGSRSGVGSCAVGARTESPTAMMRIAKIAEGEVDGGGKPGGLEAGADGAAESGTEGEESVRKRGGGGSLRGRGGVAIGRSAFAVSFPSAASAASAGSEGVRAALGMLTVLTSGNEGFERRRIGGG